MPIVGFVHTAPAHGLTFDGLVRRLAPGVTPVSVCDEGLLDATRRLGPDGPSVRAGLEAALDVLVAAGADVVVCTCSTVAAGAEALGATGPVPVIRIDRPLARAAVAAGARIVVLATVESTVDPTRALLEEEATALAPLAVAPASSGSSSAISVRLVDDAWDRFEAGDEAGYRTAIRRAVEEVAGECDVVVLAQASMAPAVESLDVDVPVLTSPELAVRAALDHLGLAPTA